MNSAPRPDFFIVGAPKCGTSAMATYLGGHPEIFMPVTKEPFYFGSDLESWRRRPTRAEYLSYFAQAGNARRTGEASPGYLYSRQAPSEILEFSPGADIVIMLRDPVEMIQSYHAQQLFMGLEDIEDLELAIAEEGERAQGRHIPAGSTSYWLQYSQVARFAEHVERYQKAFGEKRVHIVLYDDLRDDVATTYRGVVRFLGCDDSFLPAFPVVNARKGVRSPALQRLVRNPPSGLRAVGRKLLPIGARVRARRSLYRLNTSDVTPRPISDAFQARLRAEFAGDVRRLSDLIGRDLGAWLPRQSPAAR